MIFSLTWLPEVLEQAGLKVAETQNWRSRGRADMGAARGVMCHHTASSASGNMPSLNLLILGRPATDTDPALPGPLAQLGLGRDGTFYIIAAGRANHAGAGIWKGVTTGNSSFIGIEAENNGVDETWPAVQLEAYQRGVAALLKKIGAGADMCCGHKEYATPTGRKIDPDFDMPAFRNEVTAYLSGKTPSPAIPAVDARRRPTLRRGDKGPAVAEAQKLLGLPAEGAFDPNTEAALRAFQRTASLVPDGILGPKSWESLSAKAPAAPAPARPGDGAKDAASAPPPPPAPAVTLPMADTAAAAPSLKGRTAIGPGGERFAFVSGKGFYTLGETPLAVWVATNPSLPPAISKSVVNVVAAMSTVEGGLEAINSYDDAHLSFGVFQWTAGVGDEPGELAALLARFKNKDPAAFQECFGRFGLDAELPGNGATTGFLVLNGQALRDSARKEVLRDIAWAYRFWRAAHHPSLRVCQFELAASRLDRFQNEKAAGRPLREWMNSELAMALLLDEHVNRPSHVPGTLENAITSIGAEASDPGQWSDREEQGLVDAYLEKRRATNMTDSSGRAAKIEDFVRRGKLSDARGSFVS